MLLLVLLLLYKGVVDLYAADRIFVLPLSIRDILHNNEDSLAAIDTDGGDYPSWSCIAHGTVHCCYCDGGKRKHGILSFSSFEEGSFSLVNIKERRARGAALNESAKKG